VSTNTKSRIHDLKTWVTIVVGMIAVAAAAIGLAKVIFNVQTVDAAEAEHKLIRAQIDRASIQVETRFQKQMEKHEQEVDKDVTRQHKELREDLKGVQQRIDAVYRQVRNGR
jgi:hypothetical protein